MYRALIRELMDMYEEIDRTTATVRSMVGIGCPGGCGACCHSTKIRVTPLEMLPVAEQIVSREQTEACLAAIETAETGRCVLFRAAPDNDIEGRCSMYPWRPVLCRLFGVQPMLTGKGERKLAACARIKLLMPDQVAAGRIAVATDASVPLPVGYAERVSVLYPSLGGSRLPINAALCTAVEWLALRAGYERWSVIPGASEDRLDRPPRAA